MPAIPFAGALVGGLISSRGAKKAANTQADSARDASAASLTAQREAQAFQQQMADRARADSEPWRMAGTNALAQMTQRTGHGGDLMGASSAFSKPFQFQEDPGYGFRQAEGMKGISNSAAARGGLLSGAALKAASQYNQNFASNEYGNAFGRYQTENTNQFNRDQTTQSNQFNRLASLANVGQVAANNNASNAMNLGQNVGAGMMNTAQQMGNNLIGAGNARASGYMAQGNALANGLNQGISAWKQMNEKPPSAYGSGGFSDWFRPKEGSAGFTGPMQS